MKLPINAQQLLLNTRGEVRVNPVKFRRHGVFLASGLRAFILTVAVMLVGCEGDETNNYSVDEVADAASDTTTAASDIDTDGDGLTDAEELNIGTSQRSADTDGDGFSDFQEVVEFGFNAANNNYRYNPLIADVPKLRVEITSVPEVFLNYSTGSEETQSKGVSRGTETSRAVTTSDTSASSYRTETSRTTGGSTGLSSREGFSFSVSTETTKSRSSESTFSYTEEQSRQNSESIENSQDFASSTGINYTDGKLALAVRFFNDSNLAISIEEVVIGATILGSSNGGSISALGNLRQSGDPSTVVLSPRQSTSNITYELPLSLGIANDILLDASGLSVDVASSVVKDVDGIAFAFRDEEVQAKTATIVMDYAKPGFPSERYQIATNVDPESGRITLAEAFGVILRVPYTLNEAGSLASVRGLIAQESLRSYWIVVLEASDGIETEETILDPEEADYDFDAFEIKAGDIVKLIYVEDADGDNVPLRREILENTDPLLADTDGDGLTDFQEIYGFDLTVTGLGGTQPETFNVRSNPLQADSDNEGAAGVDRNFDGVVNDLDELASTGDRWLTNPNLIDTDGDRIPDSTDSMPTVYTSLELREFASYTQQIANAGFDVVPVLDFKAPFVPGAQTVSFEVYRSVVRLGEDFCDESTPDCPDETLVFAGTGPNNSWPDGPLAGPLGGFITGEYIVLEDDKGGEIVFDGSNINKRFRYRIYIEVDDSLPVLVKTHEIETFESREDVTVLFTKLDVPVCIDSDPRPFAESSYARSIIAGTGLVDTVCEVYWTITVDGEIFGGQIKSEDDEDEIGRRRDNALEVSGGGLINIREQTVRSLPSYDGACFNIRLDLFEKEDGTDIYNSITENLEVDDRPDYRAGLNSKYCRENGLWIAENPLTDGKIESSYKHYLGYGGFYFERLDVILNFTVQYENN